MHESVQQDSNGHDVFFLPVLACSSIASFLLSTPIFPCVFPHFCILIGSMPFQRFLPSFPHLQHASSPSHGFSTLPPWTCLECPSSFDMTVGALVPRASFSPTIPPFRPVSCGSTQGGTSRTVRGRGGERVRSGAKEGDRVRPPEGGRNSLHRIDRSATVDGREEDAKARSASESGSHRVHCRRLFDPHTQFGLANVAWHAQALFDASARGLVLAQADRRPPQRRNSRGGIWDPFWGVGFQIPFVPLSQVALATDHRAVYTTDEHVRTRTCRTRETRGWHLQRVEDAGGEVARVRRVRTEIRGTRKGRVPTRAS